MELIILYIVILIAIFVIGYSIWKNINEISYKCFPFNIDNLDKFHKIIKQKVIPKFQSNLKIELESLNVREITQADYAFSDEFILRFTYLGEILLVVKSINEEVYLGNLKKIPDIKSFIIDLEMKLGLI